MLEPGPSQSALPFVAQDLCDAGWQQAVQVPLCGLYLEPRTWTVPWATWISDFPLTLPPVEIPIWNKMLA